MTVDINAEFLLADLVARFSKALLEKLCDAQAKGRRGWDNNDWEDDCRRGLLKHLAKGDPRDVAAYCAFMWHHGWSTKLDADVAATPPNPEDRTIFVLQEIARGRCDNGRPLGGETARQMARAALDTWPGRDSMVSRPQQRVDE